MYRKRNEATIQRELYESIEQPLMCETYTIQGQITHSHLVSSSLIFIYLAAFQLIKKNLNKLNNFFLQNFILKEKQTTSTALLKKKYKKNKQEPYRLEEVFLKLMRYRALFALNILRLYEHQNRKYNEKIN